MNRVSFVDESYQPIEQCEIRPHPFLPRIGETILLTRWVPGKQTGDYFKNIDKVDKYKITDIEWLIEPTYNNSTNIDIRIVVKKWRRERGCKNANYNLVNTNANCVAKILPRPR